MLWAQSTPARLLSEFSHFGEGRGKARGRPGDRTAGFTDGARSAGRLDGLRARALRDSSQGGLAGLDRRVLLDDVVQEDELREGQ